MICIGIDASTTKTGIAAVHIDGSYAFHELISIPAKRIKDPIKRSREMADKCATVLFSREFVVAIGIEEPIYIQNPKTTISLSILWGMLYAAARWCENIYKIPVADGKYALTESRKATKQQTINAVKLQFRIDMDEHCADAIGIALETRARYIEEGLVNAARNN